MLSFSDNPLSGELEKALEEVSAEQFKELQGLVCFGCLREDESAEFVLSVIVKWLRSLNSRKRDIGFAWILELARNYGHLFSKKENRHLTRNLYEGRYSYTK